MNTYLIVQIAAIVPVITQTELENTTKCHEKARKAT